MGKARGRLVYVPDEDYQLVPRGWADLVWAKGGAELIREGDDFEGAYAQLLETLFSIVFLFTTGATPAPDSALMLIGQIPVSFGACCRMVSQYSADVFVLGPVASLTRGVAIECLAAAAAVAESSDAPLRSAVAAFGRVTELLPVLDSDFKGGASEVAKFMLTSPEAGSIMEPVSLQLRRADAS
eukprot:CAMPEP_0197845000 /NCGR_PEP_ID=MMETSP1438-20131217/1959_1 /TAXON_ID=1461541 /ORGANISM="Pterosperma sp., Strain CCMP1384" /LENGTH=183 /DNA_ID=CAMNT_0043456061 /DNA_START=391 /DNA_END=945 /DNA_ORIENTATION=+